MNTDDVLKTKKALNKLGHFKTPRYGMTKFPDQPMIDGLKEFQRQNGLRPDGVMNPDGPTHRRMSEVLKQRQAPGNAIAEGEHEHPAPEPDPIFEAIERTRRRRHEGRVSLTQPRRGNRLPDNVPIFVPRRGAPAPVFDIKGDVGRERKNDPADILALRRALAWAGHLARAKALDATDADEEMFRSLARFQDAAGLEVEGVLKPNGATVQALNAAIEPKVREFQKRKATDERIQTAAARKTFGPGNHGATEGALDPSPFIGGGGAAALSAAAAANEVIRQHRKKQSAPNEVPDTPIPGNTHPRTDMAPPPPSVPPSKPVREGLPPKEELPIQVPLAPPTEIFPQAEERKAMLESFPDQSDELLQHIILENSRGDDETQLDTDFAIRKYDENVKRWELSGRHSHGGHSPDGTYRKERYIPPIDGIGAARTDVSFIFDEGTKDERIEDIQTADMLKDGETMDARERRNDTKIKVLKFKHKEKGEVFPLPKSRGKDREQWEKEINAIIDFHFWRRYGPPPDAK